MSLDPISGRKWCPLGRTSPTVEPRPGYESKVPSKRSEDPDPHSDLVLPFLRTQTLRTALPVTQILPHDLRRIINSRYYWEGCQGEYCQRGVSPFFVERPSGEPKNLVEADNGQTPGCFALSNHLEMCQDEPEDTVDEANSPDSQIRRNSEPTINNDLPSKQPTYRYVFNFFPNQFSTRYPANRAIEIFSSGLEKDYPGPMGLTGSSGLSVRSDLTPSTTAIVHKPQTVSDTTDSLRSGSAGLTRQECHSPCSRTTPRRVHKFVVSSPQERWWKSSSSKFETSKPIFVIPTFQDGRCSYAERPSEEGRFFDKNRSKRCLFDRANLEGSPKVLALSMERDNARVCMPSFLSSHSTQGIYKVNETSGSHVETKGGAADYLFRRHSNHGRIAEPSIASCCLSSEPSRKSGICNQLQKIPTNSVSTDRVLRFSNIFCNPFASTTRREVTENKEKMSPITRIRGNIGTRIIKIPGPPNLIYPSHIPNPSSLQKPSETKKLKLIAAQKSYEAVVSLDCKAKEEIVWWRDHLQGWNGKALFQEPVDLIIETDASRKGWGHIAKE